MSLIWTPTHKMRADTAQTRTEHSHHRSSKMSRPLQEHASHIPHPRIEPPPTIRRSSAFYRCSICGQTLTLRSQPLTNCPYMKQLILHHEGHIVQPLQEPWKTTKNGLLRTRSVQDRRYGTRLFIEQTRQTLRRILPSKVEGIKEEEKTRISYTHRNFAFPITHS